MLLRTYRLGHARFSDWLLTELARHTGDARLISAGTLTRLESAVAQVAVQAACAGVPVFLPRDESSAWAWLPPGIRDRFDSAEASTAQVSADIHFAFGDPRKALAGSA
jgi:hypothetical protein